MPSLDSTLLSLMQPLYSVLPCQAPTTSCQASVRLGQALLIPWQILPTSLQLCTSINLHTYLCRVKAHLHAASHCTGCIERHPEHQPQLWSREELVSGNQKSIYTMPFVSDLGYRVHLFYPLGTNQTYIQIFLSRRERSFKSSISTARRWLIPCYDHLGAPFH